MFLSLMAHAKTWITRGRPKGCSPFFVLWTLGRVTQGQPHNIKNWPPQRLGAHVEEKELLENPFMQGIFLKFFSVVLPTETATFHPSLYIYLPADERSCWHFRADDHPATQGAVEQLRQSQGKWIP